MTPATPIDAKALAQAKERLEAEVSSRLEAAAELRERSLEGIAKSVSRFEVDAADLRLVLDALREAERVADAGKRYFQSHYTRWAEGGGPNECEHGIAAGIDCLLCDEKTLNGWKEPQ